MYCSLTDTDVLEKSDYT